MTREAEQLSFFDHLDELRSRLIKVFAAILLFSFGAFHFKDWILAFMTKPLENLVFTAPSDAFVVQVGISFFVGTLLAMPVILYQLWQFLSSALKEQEKRMIYSFGPVSLLLFILGTLFAYFIVVPISLGFLLSFSSDILVPMISVRSYISFLMTMVLAFGVIFEFPLLILFLAKIGIATPAFLVQKRRYTIVLIFIVSAILTPPDLFSLFLMAVPLLVMYELSILAAKYMTKEDLAFKS